MKRPDYIERRDARIEIFSGDSNFLNDHDYILVPFHAVVDETGYRFEDNWNIPQP